MMMPLSPLLIPISYNAEASRLIASFNCFQLIFWLLVPEISAIPLGFFCA